MKVANSLASQLLRSQEIGTNWILYPYNAPSWFLRVQEQGCRTRKGCVIFTCITISDNPFVLLFARIMCNSFGSVAELGRKDSQSKTVVLRRFTDHDSGSTNRAPHSFLGSITFCENRGVDSFFRSSQGRVRRC